MKGGRPCEKGRPTSSWAALTRSRQRRRRSSRARRCSKSCQQAYRRGTSGYPQARRGGRRLWHHQKNIRRRGMLQNAGECRARDPPHVRHPQQQQHDRSGRVKGSRRSEGSTAMRQGLGQGRSDARRCAGQAAAAGAASAAAAGMRLQGPAGDGTAAGGGAGNDDEGGEGPVGAKTEYGRDSCPDRSARGALLVHNYGTVYPPPSLCRRRPPLPAAAAAPFRPPRHFLRHAAARAPAASGSNAAPPPRPPASGE